MTDESLFQKLPQGGKIAICRDMLADSLGKPKTSKLVG
jgi:hypothetical protein